MYISDDFKEGNDAEGQYSFVPLVKETRNEIRPNPSFDLCRLAVSMIDGIFPKVPAKIPNGAVLSKETGLTVTETVSPLYNMIWSWMIDDSGCNILREENGDERFPSFDLYSHGAAHMVAGKPQDQISRELFKQFRVEQKDIESWELEGQNGQIYPLFF